MINAPKTFLDFKLRFVILIIFILLFLVDSNN